MKRHCLPCTCDATGRDVSQAIVAHGVTAPSHLGRRSGRMYKGRNSTSYRYIGRSQRVLDVSTPPWIVLRVHFHAMMSSGACDMMCYPQREPPCERAERGHRRSFLVQLGGSYMTSRYMCRAYHVSDVSKPPWIVQKLHRHAMMSSGARDMMCYLQRKRCYA